VQFSPLFWNEPAPQALFPGIVPEELGIAGFGDPRNIGDRGPLVASFGQQIPRCSPQTLLAGTVGLPHVRSARRNVGTGDFS